MEYDDLVQRAKELVKKNSDIRWELGDLSIQAVKCLSPNTKGKLNPAIVGKILQRWERDIGWESSHEMMLNVRSVTKRWPKKYRNHKCSWYVHAALAAHPNRFEIIKSNPTHTEARRLQGYRVVRSNDKLVVQDGIKRLQSVESFLKSAARIDYSKATEEEIAYIGELVVKIDSARQDFLISAGMDEPITLYIN